MRLKPSLFLNLLLHICPLSPIKVFCLVATARSGACRGGFPGVSGNPLWISPSTKKILQFMIQYKSLQNYKYLMHYYNLQFVGLHLTKVHTSLNFNVIKWALIRITHVQVVLFEMKQKQTILFGCNFIKDKCR